MRKLFLPTLLFCLLSNLISAQKPAKPTNLFDLKDALAQKLISIQIEFKAKATFATNRHFTALYLAVIKVLCRVRASLTNQFQRRSYIGG